MDTVGEIQDAGKQIAELQRTLETMQQGLETAESVAIAAEDARRRSKQIIKISVGLLITSILAIVLTRRRTTSH